MKVENLQRGTAEPWGREGATHVCIDYSTYTRIMDNWQYGAEETESINDNVAVFAVKVFRRRLFRMTHLRSCIMLWDVAKSVRPRP
jgi:hypothetical protein